MASFRAAMLCAARPRVWELLYHKYEYLKDAIHITVL